jgi:hypothetical protein
MEIGERKLRATTARAPQTVGTNASYINAACGQSRHGEQAQLWAGALFRGANHSKTISYVYGKYLYIIYLWRCQGVVCVDVFVSFWEWNRIEVRGEGLRAQSRNPHPFKNRRDAAPPRVSGVLQAKSGAARKVVHPPERKVRQRRSFMSRLPFASSGQEAATHKATSGRPNRRVGSAEF